MSPIEKHLQGLLELSPDSCHVCLEDTPLTSQHKDLIS